MITWLILLALIIFIFILLKFKHTFSRVRLVLILGILLFFLLSLYGLINMKSIDFDGPKAVMNSVVVYSGWIKDVGVSTFNGASGAVSMIGNVIRGNTTKTNFNDGRK